MRSVEVLSLNVFRIVRKEGRKILLTFGLMSHKRKYETVMTVKNEQGNNQSARIN